MIGEGHHAELGGVHAEVAALADCRERGHDPAGATIYVSLEPCAHHGRQPPCTDAILAAGIARVVIGCRRPEREGERARARASCATRASRSASPTAPRPPRARLANQPFRKHARTGRPLVTLKSALSLDGFTATELGRLEVDLRGREPRAGPRLARRGRRGRGRDRHRARRRPAADRARRRRPRAAPAGAGRLRLRRPPAARLEAGRLDRRGAALRGRRGRRAPPSASRRCATPGAEVIEVAGERPARIARRARRARAPRDHLAAARGRRRARGRRSSTPARSTSCACSSPRCCSAPAGR